MVTIEIKTPVLPKKATETKLIAEIKKIVKDKECKVRFFEIGTDFYGEKKFEITAFNEDMSEKQEIANAVMVLILNILFQNN